MVNPSFSTLLGYSEEELLSNPIVDFIHPDDKNKTFEDVNSSIKTEFEFDSLELSLDIAIPLGLLINELVTNSLKYAYESHSSPPLKVSIKTRNDHFLFATMTREKDLILRE